MSDDTRSEREVFLERRTCVLLREILCLREDIQCLEKDILTLLNAAEVFDTNELTDRGLLALGGKRDKRRKRVT